LNSPKLAGHTRNRVLYRDGIPIALLEGGEIRFHETLEASSEWEARKTLLRS
jgi:ATP-dependent Lhr-like helicase